MTKQILWAYGVTTCRQRLETCLPATLTSLAAGGFPCPHLFLDGGREAHVTGSAFLQLHHQEHGFAGLTCWHPPLRAFGAWCLALGELYVRNPTAHRYALFQDDILVLRNLRAYLDRVAYPDGIATGDRHGWAVGEAGRPLAQGYLNLITYPGNQLTRPVDTRGRPRSGFYPAFRYGQGAQALVFSRPAVQALLSHPVMVTRPTDAARAWRNIDGAVVESLKRRAGWEEYVHWPTLVDHTERGNSVIGEYTPQHGPQPPIPGFPGAAYDALDLLKEGGA